MIRDRNRSSPTDNPANNRFRNFSIYNFAKYYQGNRMEGKVKQVEIMAEIKAFYNIEDENVNTRTTKAN